MLAWLLLEVTGRLLLRTFKNKCNLTSVSLASIFIAQEQTKLFLSFPLKLHSIFLEYVTPLLFFFRPYSGFVAKPESHKEERKVHCHHKVHCQLIQFSGLCKRVLPCRPAASTGFKLKTPHMYRKIGSSLKWAPKHLQDTDAAPPLSNC